MGRRLARWRHWWAVHLRWWWDDARLLLRRTVSEFTDDHCTQLAASISYYVLFSIFPLAILVVSISGLILQDDSLRQDVIDEIFNALPLSEQEGRADLEDAIDGIATGFSALGLLSVFGLLWSATGMMGALRHGLNQAWDVEFTRPFLRGKAVDLLMISGVALLLGLSIGSTIFLQVARRVSRDLSDWLGPLGEGASFGVEVLAVLLPLSLSFLVFLTVYYVVPDVRTRWRHVWPGALLAAIGFELIKNGFAIYLRYFGDYDAVYGSLGAVIAFLFFVYLSANILLLGAEMAAEWPRVIHGHYEMTLRESGPSDAAPLWRRLGSALRGLVVREQAAPRDIDVAGADPEARAARRARKAEALRRPRRPAPRSDAGQPPGEDGAPREDGPRSEDGPT